MFLPNFFLKSVPLDQLAQWNWTLMQSFECWKAPWMAKVAWHGQLLSFLWSLETLALNWSILELAPVCENGCLRLWEFEHCFYSQCDIVTTTSSLNLGPLLVSTLFWILFEFYTKFSVLWKGSCLVVRHSKRLAKQIVDWLNRFPGKLECLLCVCCCSLHVPQVDLCS